MSLVAKPGFSPLFWKWVGSGSIMGLVLFFTLPQSWIEGKYQCLYQKWLGFQCPGCGMTHALLALRRGNLPEAITDNPFSLFIFASLVVFSTCVFGSPKKPFAIGLDLLYFYLLWIFWGLFLR